MGCIGRRCNEPAAIFLSGMWSLPRNLELTGTGSGVNVFKGGSQYAD